jgi:hypothetical protein
MVFPSHKWFARLEELDSCLAREFLHEMREQKRVIWARKQLEKQKEQTR